MDTTGIILIAAAGVGLYALSNSQAVSGSGGAGAGTQVGSPDSVQNSTNNPLDNIKGILSSFMQPANVPTNQVAPTNDATVSKKAASSGTTSYVESNGQVVNAANFSMASGGVAYASPSGQINAANYSSAITGGPAYASPVPSNANFSSATQGSIYVAPPTTTKKSSSSGGGSSGGSSSYNYTPAAKNYTPVQSSSTPAKSPVSTVSNSSKNFSMAPASTTKKASTPSYYTAVTKSWF